jgi:hypothetical protein
MSHFVPKLPALKFKPSSGHVIFLSAFAEYSCVCDTRKGTILYNIDANFNKKMIFSRFDHPELLIF